MAPPSDRDFLYASFIEQRINLLIICSLIIIVAFIHAAATRNGHREDLKAAIKELQHDQHE